MDNNPSSGCGLRDKWVWLNGTSTSKGTCYVQARAMYMCISIIIIHVPHVYRHALIVQYRHVLINIPITSAISFAFS